MREWTGIEIAKRTIVLENATALAIGRFIIQFSRLEMTLGLAIVWEGGGKDLERLSSDVVGESFGIRLERFRNQIKKIPVEKRDAINAYEKWLASAAAVRDVRNRFIHGRWGICTTIEKVSNVVGMPTSPEQKEYLYDVSELESEAANVAEVTKGLLIVLEKWPLRP